MLQTWQTRNIFSEAIFLYLYEKKSHEKTMKRETVLKQEILLT